MILSLTHSFNAVIIIILSTRAMCAISLNSTTFIYLLNFFPLSLSLSLFSFRHEYLWAVREKNLRNLFANSFRYFKCISEIITQKFFNHWLASGYFYIRRLLNRFSLSNIGARLWCNKTMKRQIKNKFDSKNRRMKGKRYFHIIMSEI
jgi:hypothetical protein